MFNDGETYNIAIPNILDYYEMDNESGKYKVILRFENNSDNKNPDYASEQASGIDLRANIDPDILPKGIDHHNGSFVLKSGSTALIPTGIKFDIPEGYEIQIRPRSGLAFKNGITVLNSPGTVDSDYTGEIKIILYNTGAIDDFTFKNGDRIAQAVLTPVMSKSFVSLKLVDKLNKDTDRGSGGFNSTGIK